MAMASLIGSFAMAGGRSETATPGGTGAVDEERSFTFVYAEVNPLDSIVGRTGTKFAEEVERLTDGSVTIDIRHSGVLGDEAAVLDAMLGGSGTIDMSRDLGFRAYQLRRPEVEAFVDSLHLRRQRSFLEFRR